MDGAIIAIPLQYKDAWPRISSLASVALIGSRRLLRSHPHITVVNRGEIIHRRLDAALLMRNAGKLECHLSAGQRAEQHQLVDVAKVADAEHLAGKRAETRAVRDIEMLERERAEGVAVVTLGHHHC